jgi:hypothetical protein
VGARKAERAPRPARFSSDAGDGGRYATSFAKVLLCVTEEGMRHLLLDGGSMIDEG